MPLSSVARNWIGTQKGLVRYDGLSHPDVRSMLELFDGRLLIGSDGNGIDIFSRQQGLISAWRVGQAPAPGQSQTGALPDAAIHSLAQTGDGSVWAGTLLAGAVRQRPARSARAKNFGLYFRADLVAVPD